MFCLSLLFFPSACGGSHHVVRAEAAEDADGADHFPVQVCLPGPHSVPQELPPHLSLGSCPLTLHGVAEWHNNGTSNKHEDCGKDTVWLIASWKQIQRSVFFVAVYENSGGFSYKLTSREERIFVGLYRNWQPFLLISVVVFSPGFNSWTWSCAENACLCFFPMHVYMPRVC